ncbi:MAG: restriction modification system specificity protein, partial [Gammaproteobacteria bacterium]|nr:restriction modification system specificity protein [Gammaproteobacteria bacterium]
MSDIQQLLTDHIDIWTAADTVKKSGRGRSSSNAASVHGIKKLRELILELAVRGKLVPQDPNDEPASELLKRIQAEKAKLIAEGKIKKAKPLPPITEEEKPFDLPHGWEWVRLGSTIEYINGYAFASSDFTSGGIGVVKIGDIQNGYIKTKSMSTVSKNILVGLDERLKVKPGDLVIAMSGATTGKLGFNETQEAFYLNQRVGKIHTYFTSKKFMFFNLSSKIEDNLKKSFGSAIPNLSTDQINAIALALPPLPEQHRIVAKIDELMALCDQLEAQHNNATDAHEKLVSHLLGILTQSKNAGDFNENWQRIAAHFDTLFTTESSIEILKQTLLQLAVMGKLVPQDPNDEPASELLKRIQAEKTKLVAEGRIRKDKPLPPIAKEEKLFALPQGWEWVRLGQIGNWGAGATPLRSISSYYGGKTPWFKSGELTADFIDTSEETITDLALKECSLRLNQPGDVLLAMYGATIGKAAILKIAGTTNQAVCACTPYRG